MTPSTIVRYVSLSWLLLTANSFCPPSSPRAKLSQLHDQEPQQLTLSEAEDLEEARLDAEERLARKRDALQNSRLNEMFAEEDSERERRQEEINKMLEEDDEVWREERKKRMLGKFAGMESGEVKRALIEEMEKEQKGEYFLFMMMGIEKRLQVLTSSANILFANSNRNTSAGTCRCSCNYKLL